MIEPGEIGGDVRGGEGFRSAIASRLGKDDGPVDFGFAGMPAAVSPEIRSRTELVALVHIKAAGGKWQRAGGGKVAMAHRLAASVLFSLVTPSSKQWRLSSLVRDIIALGEEALPVNLMDLARIVEPLAGEAFLSVAEQAAGGLVRAGERYREVVALACSIAREVSALP